MWKNCTDEPCPVYVHTIDGHWLSGKVQHSDPCSPFLGIDFQGSPKPGTSGSPVLDEAGRVVGIAVSSAMDEDRYSVVKLAGALPGWALHAIRERHARQAIAPDMPDNVLPPESSSGQKPGKTTRKKSVLKDKAIAPAATGNRPRPSSTRFF